MASRFFRKSGGFQEHGDIYDSHRGTIAIEYDPNVSSCMGIRTDATKYYMSNLNLIECKYRVSIGYYEEYKPLFILKKQELENVL